MKMKNTWMLIGVVVLAIAFGYVTFYGQYFGVTDKYYQNFYVAFDDSGTIRYQNWMKYSVYVSNSLYDIGRIEECIIDNCYGDYCDWTGGTCKVCVNSVHNDPDSIKPGCNYWIKGSFSDGTGLDGAWRREMTETEFCLQPIWVTNPFDLEVCGVVVTTTIPETTTTTQPETTTTTSVDTTTTTLCNGCIEQTVTWYQKLWEWIKTNLFGWL